MFILGIFKKKCYLPSGISQCIRYTGKLQPIIYTDQCHTVWTHNVCGVHTTSWEQGIGGREANFPERSVQELNR